MLTSRNILALRIGDFVCRSCLSKLRLSQRRQPCCTRNLSNGGSSQCPKAARKYPDPPVDREIHFYDQTPDGNQVERFVDDAYERKMRDTFIDESLRRTIEENSSTMKKLFESSIPSEYELDEDSAILEAEGDKIKAFTDRVDEAGDVDKLSPEEREKLRVDLMEFGLFDDLGEKPVHESSSSNPKEDIDNEDEEICSPQHVKLDSCSRFQNFFSPNTQDQTFPDSASQVENTPTTQVKQDQYRFSVASFPKSYQPNIASLQDCLHAYFYHDPSIKKRGKAAKVTKDMLRSHLARSYMLARKGLLSAPDLVPSIFWDGLWQAFESNSKENFNRLIYIRRLGDDIDEMGVSISPSNRLLYIEALFMDGARKSAISKWQETKPLREDPLWDEYWEIGLRMLAQVGRVDEAFKVAEDYFEGMHLSSRYRALMPLIRACIQSKKQYSIQRAWALYLRLRVNLGDEMKMEDYDILISWFMEAQYSDLALAVFRDMMLTGEESKDLHDSTVLYKMSGMISDFNGVKIQQSELEWEDTRTLAVLPAKFHNKFFFGSWIKKLIGDNELNSAKKVLDLMQDFGIRPASMHMNGLIGAWFRRGDENDFAKADDLAWRMIKIRLEFVGTRKFYRPLREPLRPIINGHSRGDKSAFLFPIATIETFSLLVQQYRQRQNTTSLSALYMAFLKSKISPNTRYMNQIILTDTREHKPIMAFETYRSLTEKSVRPDFETFILLWHLMKKSVDPSVGRKSNKQSPHIGTCRTLFKEMMKWKEILIERKEFPRELYDLVILSFSLKQDQVGTATALRALQQEFDIYPDHNCVRAIVLQLARQGLRNDVGMKPRRLNLSLPLTRDRIGGVLQFFHLVKKNRAEDLLKRGIVPDQMSNEARKEESIVIMIDVLHHVTVARLIGESRKNYNSIMAAEQAAEQMGVPGCVVWKAN